MRASRLSTRVLRQISSAVSSTCSRPGSGGLLRPGVSRGYAQLLPNYSGLETGADHYPPPTPPTSPSISVPIPTPSLRRPVPVTQQSRPDKTNTESPPWRDDHYDEMDELMEEVDYDPSSDYYYRPRDSNVEPIQRDPTNYPSIYSTLSEDTSAQRHDWRERAYSRRFAHHNRRSAIVDTGKGSQSRGKGKAKAIPNAPYPNPPRNIRVDPPTPHVAYHERFGPEIDAYKLKFEKLLEHEEDEQFSTWRDRLKNWSLTKLVDEGYTVKGLRGYWLDLQESDRRVAIFSSAVGEEVGWNRFDPGSVVSICRVDPLTGDEEPVAGTVVRRSPSSIQIMLDDEDQLHEQGLILEEGEWRLDLGANSVVFRRMRAAIDAFNHDPRKHELKDHSEGEFIMAGTFLRDALLKSSKPLTATTTASDPTESSSPGGVFSSNQLINSWALRHRRPNSVVVEGDPILDLNETQTRAVALMLSEPISLVQGPPGTGKTRTIIEAVKLLKMFFEVPQPILVATYTNVAVDNLVDGLASAGLNPLRVGADKHATNPKLDKYKLGRIIERRPEQKIIETIEKSIEKLLAAKRLEIDKSRKETDKNEKKRVVQEIRVRFSQKLAPLYKRKWAIYLSMVHDIVSKSDVICTTCVSSASYILRVTDFPVVFADEASMSTEPAAIIPLMKGSRHVALIGDHKQLPPVITSQEAQAGGLSKSLFERLIDEGHVPSIMLDTQYRMHPTISRFPSDQFYDSSLRDGTVDAESGAVRPSLHPPKSVLLETGAPPEAVRPSVVFVDHACGEGKKDRSRINQGEAQIVCGIVEDLLANNPGLNGENIGIIAPYVAQIALLDRLLKHDRPQAEQFQRTLGAHRALQTSLIEVKTVDGFEGREKDVIIFSTVRNNAQGAIGFLADGRRLNVGLTRARRALFVLGNAGTLRVGLGWSDGKVVVGGQRVWRKYVEWLEKEQLIRRWAGGSFLPLGLGRS